MLRFLLLIALACIWIPQTASALPDQIAHEGLLFDPGGRRLSGEHDLRLRLWDQLEGGGLLFEETHPNVSFHNGYYSLQIGSREPLRPELMWADLFLSIGLDGAEDLSPRIPILKLPGALVTEEARSFEGPVHPDSLSVGGVQVINAQGIWVGDDQDLSGPQGAVGPEGEQGPAGNSPAHIRAALIQVDGSGSHLDFDRLDGHDSAEFARTPAQLLNGVLQGDGAGSGLDVDRLDGLDSSEFIHSPEAVRDEIRSVDGEGSGVDADRLDGLDSGAFLRSNEDITVGGNARVNQLFYALSHAGPPVPCMAHNQGSIYFDTVLNIFMACSGADWGSLEEGGGGDGGGSGGDGIGGPRDPTLDVSGYFPDTRLTPDGWQSLPGRLFNFHKDRDNSTLRINYSDVLGYDMQAESPACYWRLLVGQDTTRNFTGHSSQALGLRLWPTNMEWYLQNLPAGDHQLRIQVLRGPGAVQCLAGWSDGEAENFISVEELDSARLGLSQHMEESSTASTSWVDVPGRHLVYAKQDNNTLLRVAYMDNLGYNMSAAGWACHWRLTMDGAVIQREVKAYANSDRDGWRIHPRHLTWIIPHVAVGQHHFKIQVQKMSTGVSQCLSGWPNGATANSLSVQEIEPASLGIIREMAYTNSTPNVWTALPGRDLTHIKEEAATQIRISYLDTLGTNMLTRGWGCRWRLTVDGEAHGRPFNTYNSDATGWRMDPSHLQWIISDLPAGSHRYRIENLRPDNGSTEYCRAGWSSPQNHLLAEEIHPVPAAGDGGDPIPARTPSPDVSGYFADNRHSPLDWEDLPGRSFSFEKQAEDTTLRVNYEDVLGYDMISENPACAWRLQVDNINYEPFAGFSSSALGLRLWPSSLEWYLEGLRAGVHNFQIQVRQLPGAGQCLAGWIEGETENFIEVEELDSARLAITQGMSEEVTASTSWVDVPGRSVTYQKQDEETHLKVSYMDNLGYNMKSSGVGCHWRLTMDGAVMQQEVKTYSNTSHDGWRIHPRHLVWVLPHIAMGQHTFKLQIIKASTGVSQCLTGWPSGGVGNSFVVQELDVDEASIIRNLSYQQSAPDVWTNITSRDLVHEKRGAHTQVRITYTDTLGITMTTRGWGCRWRLTVDGAVRGRPFNTYNSDATGWRTDPSYLQWVVNDLEPGEHRYRIQLLRPDAQTSSACRAGHGSPHNFLFVEEVNPEVIDDSLPTAGREASTEVSDYAPDSRLSPGAWTDLPGRLFLFNKATAESTLRVNYADVLGYDMQAEGPACSWRLSVNGAATRSFGGNSSQAHGLRLWPTNLEWFLKDLPAGPLEFKIQVLKGAGATQCLAGWQQGDAENFIEVEELDSYYVGVTEEMGESATASTSWVDVPGRVLVYEKKEDDSAMKVHYMDNLGYNMSSSGWACNWRLLMDDKVIQQEAKAYSNTSKDGWRTHPNNLSWLILDAALGEHTFKIQVIKASTGVSQCVSGWPNAEVANSLSVQEFNGGEMALKREMAYTNSTPNSWSNLPSRDIVHDKQEVESQIRVTYTDTLGTSMLTRGWGCRWQLTVDNEVKGRPYSSYNSNATGWRMDPSRLQWIVNGLSTGAHQYRIQLVRPDTLTTEYCRAGWSSPQNSLLIEEIGREVPEPPPGLPPRVASAEVSDYLAYTELSPQDWTDLPGREFGFNKSSAESVLRLNYSDMLGYNMNSEGPACSWRLLVDNTPTRTFGGFSSEARGVRLWPSSLEWHLEGLSQGAHQFKIQVKRGAGVSQCYAGWSDGEAENFIEVEELEASRTGITLHMGENATNSTSWVDLPGRTLIHHKQEDPTIIKVSYMDNLGYNMSAAGWACHWRLLMDNAVVQKEAMAYANSSHDGWRTHPHNLSWVIPHVSMGQHTFKIQVKKLSTGVSQCISGWPDGQVANALVVQEFDGSDIAIRQDLSYVSSAPNSWTNITNRDLNHEKKAEASQIRVTYVDSLGVEMLLRGQGCRWQLTVDDQPQGRPYNTYNSEATGWRLGYGKMQWIINGLSAASHNYKVRMVRPDASRTNACRQGWNTPQNYLMVEEIGHQPQAPVPLPDRGASAQNSGNFPENQQSSNAWEDLPGRSFDFNKAGAASNLRVSYSDVLGYDMIGEASACAWRLLLDGVAQKSFGGYSSKANGPRLWPTKMEWYFEGLAAGAHNLKIQQRRDAGAGRCLAGWPDGEAENFIQVEELAPDRSEIVQDMGESATASTSWVDVPGRSLSYNKAEELSLLKVSYMDDLGYNMNAAGWACHWRLLMDGTAVQQEAKAYANARKGWRTHPRDLNWVISDVPSGPHDFKIQVKKMSTGVSQCISGWPNGGVANSFVVEEVPEDSLTIIRGMAYTNSTPNSWTALPSRDLSHTKAEAGTRIRVSYMDTIGTSMLKRGWGCRWRLNVDTLPQGRIYSSYNSDATGWRMDPTEMEWIIPGLPAGEHRYRIELLRPDNTTTEYCRAGWSSPQNFLLIEELP